MAIFQIEYFSQQLQTETPIAIATPRFHQPKEFQVLYLLHGMLDGHSSWLRQTGIERFIEQTNLMVVMPFAGRSLYTDMKMGGQYFSYITQELPQYIEGLFSTQEKSFVAGLSMGGYGAMKWALSQPDKFLAAGSFSGALDIANLFQQPSTSVSRDELIQCFGSLDAIAGSDQDLMALLTQCPEKLPLFQRCGRDDFLLDANEAFAKAAIAADFPLDYQVTDGAHDWAVWDLAVAEFLDWLKTNQWLDRADL